MYSAEPKQILSYSIKSKENADKNKHSFETALKYFVITQVPMAFYLDWYAESMMTAKMPVQLNISKKPSLESPPNATMIAICFITAYLCMPTL